MKISSLPNFLFCGCNQAGNELLYTIGASLKSTFLFSHYPQLQRGSGTGSQSYGFSLIKQLFYYRLTGYQLVKIFKNTLQLTQRQLNFLAISSYSKGYFSSFGSILLNIIFEISMTPCSTAKSIGLRSFNLLTKLTSAPLQINFFTIYNLFFLIAMVKAVYPLGVIVLGLAPLPSTYTTDSQFKVKVALIKRLCFVSFKRGLSRSSGFLLKIQSIFPYYLLFM